MSVKYKQVGNKKILSAIVLLGSARSEGNTQHAIQNVETALDIKLPLIDLSQHDVQPFDYEFNQNDDFQEIIHTLLEYDVIIFATPVYWYSVSAQIKSFIDRLSDLLIIDKDTGRALRGKRLAIISSYHVYPEGNDGFEMPLINLARYLGMHYLSTYFHYTGDNPEGIQSAQHTLEIFKNYLKNFKQSSL